MSGSVPFPATMAFESMAERNTLKNIWNTFRTFFADSEIGFDWVELFQNFVLAQNFLVENAPIQSSKQAKNRTETAILSLLSQISRISQADDLTAHLWGSIYFRHFLRLNLNIDGF